MKRPRLTARVIRGLSQVEAYASEKMKIAPKARYPDRMGYLTLSALALASSGGKTRPRVPHMREIRSCVR